MLINREFDLMGVGRYQKCIWVLCGFGYLLDLVWAQAFSLGEHSCFPYGSELSLTLSYIQPLHLVRLGSVVRNDGTYYSASRR